MWKLGGFFVVMVVLFTTVFLLGPKVKVDTTLREPALPSQLSQLDKWLAKKESVVENLRPGTNKQIVWFDKFQKQQTEWSVVYLHGFSASRQEIDPVPRKVAAALRANLFYTRLRGHGRDSAALGKATVNQWLNDSLEALRIGEKLGKKVVLFSTSTGSTLAMWLGCRPGLSKNVVAHVMTSPNFEPKNKTGRLLLKPWGRLIAQIVTGGKRSWTPRNKEQAMYWTTTYPANSLVTLMALVGIVEKLDLSKVTQPLQILYSPEDKVIDTKLVVKRFKEFRNPLKELVAVHDTSNPSNHVLTGRILSPGNVQSTTKRIVTFLLKVKASTKLAPTAKPGIVPVDASGQKPDKQPGHVPAPR